MQQPPFAVSFFKAQTSERLYHIIFAIIDEFKLNRKNSYIPKAVQKLRIAKALDIRSREEREQYKIYPTLLTINL